MVNSCVNTKCAKPLHYLREGRVFIFVAKSHDSSNIHGIEHYWLCGVCSQTMCLEKTCHGVRIVPKSDLRMQKLNPQETRTEPS